jgi:hypothetical protein
MLSKIAISMDFAQVSSGTVQITLDLSAFDRLYCENGFREAWGKLGETKC